MKPNAFALEHFRLARAHATKNEANEAIASYEAAIAAAPQFAEAHVNLGILYGQLGPSHAETAVDCLRHGIRLRPGNPRAHYNLGVILSRESSRAYEAIDALETVIALEPGHKNALYALSVLWTREGDLTRAGRYYQRYRRAMDPANSADANRQRQRSRAPTLRLRFISEQ